MRICGNSKQLTRLQNYRLLDNGAWMCTTGKSSAHFQPYNGDDDAADAELKRAGAAGPHTVLRFVLAPLCFHFSFLLTACCLFTVCIGLSPVAGVCGGLRRARGLYRPDLRPARPHLQGHAGSEKAGFFSRMSHSDVSDGHFYFLQVRERKVEAKRRARAEEGLSCTLFPDD